HDHVRPRAETVLGSEAAKVDVVDHPRRKGLHRRAGIAMRNCSDRRGRAGNQGHQRALHFRRIEWLPVHTRLVAMIVKRFGSNLPAGVTIDARRIDVEIACYILWQPLFQSSHMRRVRALLGARVMRSPGSTWSPRHTKV